MNRVAVLPSARFFVSTPTGLDFDRDAKR